MVTTNLEITFFIRNVRNKLFICFFLGGLGRDTYLATLTNPSNFRPIISVKVDSVLEVRVELTSGT